MFLAEGAYLGYDNASKFAAAFKSVIGMAPHNYRKSAV
ncbi:helix-turn-helix domain-containing protein [Acetobacterium bakii]|nr:helix-turn-helix domain-containing protein [Acetobacterium bakii]